MTIMRLAVRVKRVAHHHGIFICYCCAHRAFMTHTKHHELHFVLVWFRVDSCEFVDRPPVKTLLKKQEVVGLLHRLRTQ